MKKCFLLLGSLVALGGVAFADSAGGDVGESDYYIYWMADPTKPADAGEDWGFDAAELVVVLDDNSTQKGLDGGFFFSINGEDELAPVEKMPKAQKADLRGLSREIAGFYIEFYNYTNGSTDPIGTSDRIGIDAMRSAITDLRDPLHPSASTGGPATFSSWTAASAAPEPTSGLLLVLGCGLLGLRRKRSV